MISPSDRIILIRKSLNIFVCGIVGIVPVIGVIPAIFAIVGAVRVGARFRREWNPASAYLHVGVVMALLGTGITALAGLIAVLNLVPPFAGD
jgi:ABC-type phosphate transport system permease subunit